MWGWQKTTGKWNRPFLWARRVFAAILIKPIQKQRSSDWGSFSSESHHEPLLSWTHSQLQSSTIAWGSLIPSTKTRDYGELQISISMKWLWREKKISHLSKEWNQICFRVWPKLVDMKLAGSNPCGSNTRVIICFQGNSACLVIEWFRKYACSTN